MPVKDKGLAIYCLLLALLLPAVTAPALAQGMKTSSPIERGLARSPLKSGEWIWAPEIAPDGPIMIYVDLSRQMASIYRNGVRIGASSISSGKKGYETPTGVFTILQKDIDHHSNKYDNAAMPFTQRVTWDGVALHAGGLPGYPESHGCVHLPYRLAQELFKVTSLGATVIIDDGNAVPMRVEGGDLLLPVDAAMPVVGDRAEPAGESSDLDYQWYPDRAPTGPVTILVSRQDQMIVVIRNGVEIGWAKIKMPVTDMESHVLTLTEDENGERQWIYVGVPGHIHEAGRQLDRSVAARVKMPKAFRNAVAAIAMPGTTILVTQASIGSETTGKDLVILNSERTGKNFIRRK